MPTVDFRNKKENKLVQPADFQSKILTVTFSVISLVKFKDTNYERTIKRAGTVNNIVSVGPIKNQYMLKGYCP